MLGFGKKTAHPENAEKQETLLTLSILTLAAILCEYKSFIICLFFLEQIEI